MLSQQWIHNHCIFGVAVHICSPGRDGPKLHCQWIFAVCVLKMLQCRSRACPSPISIHLPAAPTDVPIRQIEPQIFALLPGSFINPCLRVWQNLFPIVHLNQFFCVDAFLVLLFFPGCLGFLSSPFMCNYGIADLCHKLREVCTWKRYRNPLGHDEYTVLLDGIKCAFRIKSTIHPNRHFRNLALIFLGLLHLVPFLMQVKRARCAFIVKRQMIFAETLVT
mmetsp:Transcript_104696/g.180540  ORF Transcript_104696/g.180540 Transcript_104696/m.180540 type:complete len:221 (+) Transcript_104696:2530-3192(+)